MGRILLFIVLLVVVFFNAYWVGHDVATETIGFDTLFSALATAAAAWTAHRVMSHDD